MRKKMKIILWIVVAAFLGTIFFVWGMNLGRRKDYVSQQSAAVVDGRSISNMDFDRLWTQKSQQLYGQEEEPSSEQVQRLRTDLINELIGQELLQAQFEKLGLKIYPEEVAARIAAIPAFQQDGKFSQEKYIRLLQYNRMEPAEFESDQARTLEILKMDRLLRDAMVLPEERVRAYFLARRREVKLALVNFRWQDRIRNIRIPEEAQRRYYQENRQKFYQPAQVRASHILIRTNPQASEEDKLTAKLKLDNIREELKQGANFAQLAEKYSEDPGSAKNGGDLGYFTAEDMVPAFSKAAFALKVGEVSPPVETSFGYHLIQVTGRREEKKPAFAEVASEIEKTLQEREARRNTNEDAVAFLARIKNTGDLVQAASAAGRKVTTSGWITLDSSLPQVKDSRRFLDRAFDLPLHQPRAITGLDDEIAFVEILAEKYRPFREEAYQRQRDELVERLRRQQGDELSTAWLQTAEKKADIINNIAKEQAEGVTTTARENP